MKYSLIKIIPIAGLFFLAGCSTTQYHFTPPPSESGLACVSQCQINQENCRNIEKFASSHKQQECEKTSKSELKSCEVKAEYDYKQCELNTDKEYKLCIKEPSKTSICYKPICPKKSCYANKCNHTVNDDLCPSNFRSCFKQCGGKIELIK